MKPVCCVTPGVLFAERVLLKKPVNAIHQGDSGATVRTSDGTKYQVSTGVFTCNTHRYRPVHTGAYA